MRETDGIRAKKKEKKKHLIKLTDAKLTEQPFYKVNEVI